MVAIVVIDPLRLGGEPCKDHQRAVFVIRVVGDFDRVDIRDCLLGDVIIEDTGDAKPELPRPCPGMVLDHQ